MSPAVGVWVATRRGNQVGTVERLDGAYHATNAAGRALGSFEDLASACDVVEGTQRRAGIRRANRVIIAVLWGIIGGGGAVALLLVIALFQMGGQA